ncbi:MAG TPA: aldo/keto reductase, partial [Clostridiales bacterium]|nr:aldo/keto reductase [Clostridiales bacterium]
DGEICKKAVLEALSVGYRLIDTAAAYFNEADVGAAIRESGIPREDLFITTKLWIQDAGYEAAKEAFQTSLAKLGLDYLDLYLIHQPFGDYYGAWRAMEELYEEGKIRAIGVSNFAPDRLTDLAVHARIQPMVNQVELHPFFAQEKALQNMRDLGVVPEAWGPLAEAKPELFTNETLTAMAEKYGKTVAQVVLRWNVQRGVVIIPKTVKKSRMEENLDIWDFCLTPEEMDAVSTLDLGHSTIIDHTDPASVKWLSGWKIHE